ncbi:IS110 family transposase [Mucilaginibacter sp. cycad4]|jgi:transposase|uniref:IS110 family transposase n=1 Tax=Mucilaginibacter sp. cycad4 TaxID=3342096 RepID=UPI002AAACB53|nr:IS110 family transposase [Mucilaginibacter gossypii]WPU97974.1 IS110 family transposase [Mucilaginibacter gossypii]WPU99822.1 IS110 family transposase [Mucilaginibacter gossypii]WPU99943.1 IS110 family transposase [Mucilaginibacter gossypii]
MKNLKYSVGIDVSMKDFACCISVINDEQDVKVKATHKFANIESGFGALLEWVKRHKKEDLPLIYTMEATGVYHEQLAWFLHHKGNSVSILLPNKAKKHLQADGIRSKNDKIDARGLAKVGAEKKLEQWTPPSMELYTLRYYTRQHQSLNEFYTATANQLHSIEHSQFKNKDIIKQLKSSLKLYEKHMKELEKLIAQLIQSDPILNRHYKNICAIKGLGLLSFAVIAAETNGFILFDNAASLVKYAGYDVIENESGKHTGRTKISKKGNSRIRRILHMPALCAVRDDQPQFQKLFERVYERTRIKMKGYVAVQKKLLVMMYYLWKKEEKYDPAFKKEVAPALPGATHDELLNEALIKQQN